MAPEILVLLGVCGFGLLVALFVLFRGAEYINSTLGGIREVRSDRLIQQFTRAMAVSENRLYVKSRQLEELAKKLAGANLTLEQMDNMKSKFLSMVVHDVRTPLASIRGFSELLIKKNVGEKEAQYLKNIVSSTDQLGRLISDLTDLAMIEAGKLKMEKTVIDYSDIARDILPGISINAQKKGVELAVNELPSYSPLHGDKFRLSQVLMNLLNNAIKFTPAGKRVELTLRREGRHLAAYVKDSGIGLHPSETKRIFEKFYQAKYQKDEKLRKQGWGLGLCIAQEVVRAHKGDIGAISPGLGKGSTFWFRIPAGG
ncbi:MAG TPA: hypothetical protein DCZ93_13290 [Elusimicrobia bacterium]|nr:hypothetical protein [Elusimicrobiota bacterium]